MLGSDASLNAMKLPKYRQIHGEKRKKKNKKRNKINTVIKVIDIQAPIFLNADISSFRLLVQEFTGINSNFAASYSHSSYNHHLQSCPSSSPFPQNHIHNNSDCHACTTASSRLTISEDIDYTRDLLLPCIAGCDCDPVFRLENDPSHPQYIEQEIDCHVLMNNFASDENKFRCCDLAAESESSHLPIANPSSICACDSPTVSHIIGHYMSTVSVADHWCSCYNLSEYTSTI